MSFNKIKFCSSVLVLASLLPTALFAGSMGETAPHFKGHFLAQLGGYAAIQGTPQHINVRQELVGNYYTLQSNNTGSGLVGAGLMFDGPEFYKHFSFSYGIDAFFLGQTTVKGYIVEEDRVTNLSYSYKIQNIPLYFMLQSLINTNHERWKVVVDGGVGPNFMSLGNYREISLNEYTIPDNAFSGANPVTLAATAGVALRFRYAPEKLPLECGYRFFYLGNGRFDINNYQAINAVKTGDNYANAIVCSVII